MSNKTATPNNVDNACGNAEICDLFANKAQDLYNSVSYNEAHMQDLLSRIEKDVSTICASENCYHSHLCTSEDVQKCHLLYQKR